MKKYMWAALAVCLALFCLAGCGRKDEEPVTVTLWHVYGGEVDSPLDVLVEKFNGTVGAEKNIRVKVELVSSSGAIHKSVPAAANGDPGAPALPDMFVSYPKTVLALPDQNVLVDYRDYFTEEELSAFIPAFLQEGEIGGHLAILPVAKSTEVLFVNRTLFDRYAAASGASLEELRTWGGCTLWHSGTPGTRTASASLSTTAISTTFRWALRRWERISSGTAAWTSAPHSSGSGSRMPQRR